MSEIPSQPGRYRIGYAIPPKKVQTFIQPSLIDHASLHNIELIAIDTSKPLTEQLPLHAIIHKIYDPDWTSQLLHLSDQHPDVPIIDLPQNIRKLRSRVSMLEVVSKLNRPRAKETLDVPNQVVISSDSEKPEGVKLGFPLIAKPMFADGSETSHKMCLVFDQGGLEELETPIVVQEFVNHGGVLFKVYVMGDYVQCVKRNSLADITEEQLGSSKGAVPFSLISNASSEGYANVELPEAGFVEEVAKGMRRELGLNLFNFDVIRDSKDGNRYLVIDINYFPGYAKMPNYEDFVTRFFLDVVGEKNKEEKSGAQDERE